MEASELRAGTSKIDITPPVGYKLQGHGSRNKPSEKVHDRLYAKALSLSRNGRRIVIITSDLLGLSIEFVEEARREILEKTGIEPERVMMCASHTHCGPFVLPRPDGKPWPEFIPDYLPVLAKQFAGAVREAVHNEKPVKVLFGKKNIDIGAVNRRKKNPDGTIGGPDTEGPADREASFLSFEDGEQGPCAILFNYGCHPTTVSNKIYEITADYPGAAQQELEKFYKGATALFTNGCSGDVRPSLTDSTGKKFVAGDFSDVSRMGRILAAGIIEARETALRENPEGINISDIDSRLERFSFKLDEKLLADSKEKLERNFPLLVRKLRNLGEPSDVEKEWKKMWESKLDNREPAPNSVEGDIQVMKIGPVRIAAFPGDTVSEIGLQIKKALPFAITVSNSNGRIGYIPSAQVLKDGGYEASFFFFQGFPGPYSPMMEKELIDKILEMSL